MNRFCMSTVLASANTQSPPFLFLIGLLLFPLLLKAYEATVHTQIFNRSLSHGRSAMSGSPMGQSEEAP